MRFVTKDDFDFDQAALYRKVEPLPFASVRRAERCETIMTRNSTGVETFNVAQPGDYILSGSKARYGGDGYIVTAQRFAESYEPDPKNPGCYRHKEVKRAVLLLYEVQLEPPWGGMQRIGAGGVLVAAGTQMHGIDGRSFIRHYARVEDAAPHAIICALSESLEIQEEKARIAEAWNHLADIALRCENRGRLGLNDSFDSDGQG